MPFSSFTSFLLLFPWQQECSWDCQQWRGSAIGIKKTLYRLHRVKRAMDYIFQHFFSLYFHSK